MVANVDLQIGELIVHGLPSWQRDRIAAAVVAELQRLLAEGGLPPSLAAGGTLPEVQVNELHLAAGAQPGAVGAQIAGSIYGRLAGNRPLSGSPEGSTQ